MFFGALASVQLRSRRTQSVSGRVGCGGYTRGSLQEFNGTQNFWNTICWSGDFTTEQILAWDAECYAHYNAISACWCHHHLLEECAWDFATCDKKYGVYLRGSMFTSVPAGCIHMFTLMAAHVSCSLDSRPVVRQCFVLSDALFVGASRCNRVTFPLYWPSFLTIT